MEISSSHQPSPIFSTPSGNKSLTKNEAQKVYYTLGDQNLWKQIIDGKYHEHGNMVFDEGLHGGAKEPGFYSSLIKGCHYAAEHLTEKLDLEFYKELNKTLCAHFQGSTNNTEVSSAETGKFSRIEGKRTQYRTLDLVKNADAYKDSWSNDFKNADTLWAKFSAEYTNSIKQINTEINSECSSLDIRGLIVFEPQDLTRPYKNRTLVHYLTATPELYEQVTQKLFDKYNGLIAVADSKEAKLRAIAWLFQYLEWLHPFPDGQGRTDLVLMSKLLTENGFHPAILQEPYYSTTHSLDEWLEYLKGGLEQWEKEAAL